MNRFRLPQLHFSFLVELREYLAFLYNYFRRRGYRWFAKFEVFKDAIVDLLYRRRGKYARPFLHFGTIALVFAVITFGPFVIRQTKRDQNPGLGNVGVLKSALAYGTDLSTSQSEDVKQFRNGEIVIHVVEDGETLSSIASKYNLNTDTIIWENDLQENDKLKPGQQLRILPVDGIRHKVIRGETIHTIAKKYGLGDEDAAAQPIITYPFNEFKNDENFDLTPGQILMIPGGVKPEEALPVPQVSHVAVQLTPNAGAVSATGSFIWPASGRITQGFTFYHKGFDIANHDGGPILAADSGTVTVAGWVDNTGYGNRVMIDHGNGFVTLYGHMSVIQVQVGQHVARGNVLGQMGSTGRSTGTHLHFEIRHGGVYENPGNFLK